MDAPKASADRPSTWVVWILASRPRTLGAALSPVLLGTACAAAFAQWYWPAALAALVGAVGIQIGTNLVNDYCDARQGADTVDRLGPVRVTAAGWLSGRAVLRGAALAFFVAALAGCYLIARAGWPVAVIGVVSITCGVWYTAGAKSLAYLGLGEIFTFVFFGLVATAGTAYVQALEFVQAGLWFGIIPGAYSVVLIGLNNLRDVEQDRVAGKRTPAVRFGPGFMRQTIIFFLLLPPLIVLILPGLPGHLLPLLSVIGFFVATPVLFPLWRGAGGRELNPLLGKTMRAGLAFSILTSVFLWS
jgi:1,4-dihydroxy-2-naphthoate octaprenyltransferase